MKKTKLSICVAIVYERRDVLSSIFLEQKKRGAMKKEIVGLVRVQDKEVEVGRDVHWVLTLTCF